MENLQLTLMEWLVANRKVPKKKAEEALRKSQEAKLHVEQVLVETKTLERQELLDALTAILDIPSVDLQTTKVSASVAQIIPRNMAERFNLICLKKENDRILVAMGDPSDSFALEYVKMRTGFEATPRCCYVGDLAEAMEKAYSATITFIGQGTPMKSDADRVEEKGRFVVATREKSPRENILLKSSVEGKQSPDSRSIRLEGFLTRTLTPGDDSREVHNLKALLEIGEELASTLQLDLLVRKILQSAIDLTGSEGSSLILVTPEGNELYFKESLGPKADEVKQMRFPLDEHSLVGYSVSNKTTLRINDVTHDPRHNKTVDKETDFKTRSMLCCPVFWRGQPLGALTAVNKHDLKSFTDDDQEYMEILASQAAVALHNADVMDRLTNFYTETVGIIIDLLEINDHVNRDHLVTVARFATSMGQYLNLAAPEMERLCYASLLHDIGKVRCEDPHDPAHAAVGAGILQRVRLFGDLVPVIRHHHENFDGTGFPDHLEGDQIPWMARILAVAEGWVEGTYDLAGAARDEFMRNMRYEFGSRYDPALKPAFEYALANGN